MPAEDYQELTPKEEKSLEKMLGQFEHALSNVEIFTDQLSKELQELEYVSVFQHPFFQHLCGL